jgi:hypothetical protein
VLLANGPRAIPAGRPLLYLLVRERARDLGVPGQSRRSRLSA